MVQSYLRAGLLFLLCSVACLAQAQLLDNFSDGDFDNNPTWTGSKDDFTVQAEQLQLNAAAGGESVLAVKADWKDTASWEFYFQMDFAPSSSNRLDIYLSHDKADLSADGDGYFLRIGESGSEDNLEFYKKSGSTTTKLAEGSLSTLGASTNVARIRATRSSKGVFEIFADFTGGTSYSLDLQVTDASFSEGAYFGFNCKYTSSRADKYYFDDIRIDPIYQDVVAPDFYQVSVVDERNLLLLFDEVLDQASAESTANYTVSGTAVSNASLNSSNPVEVSLELASPLVSGTNYTVTVSGVEDLVGNAISGDSESLNYFKAQLGDIIINEVFPDPTPSKGLPEAEFVELYNRSSSDIDLLNWTIADASSEVSLPAVTIKSGTYLILCNNDAAAGYTAYGDVATVALPALNNSGDDVVLRTDQADLMDRISYTTAWYNDADRSSGGYTLERINPVSKCSGSNNWRASTATVGGTPGAQNAVFDDSPDVTAPELDRSTVQSNTTFDLYFTEPFDSASAAAATYEAIGIGTASMVTVDNVQEKVQVEFATALSDNVFYDLRIDGVEDCEGNRLSETYEKQLVFVKAEEAEIYDLLITEIFADPTPVLALPEAEYIEIQNASDKVLDLAGKHLVANNDVLQLPEYVLFPGDAVVLCNASDAAKFEAYENVLAVSGFPGLTNGGELLSIRTEDYELLHFVDYSNSWYDSEDAEEGGYALEMIDLSNPCGENDNWTAAKSGTYGTPGATNSQNGNNPDEEGPVVDAIGVIDDRNLLITFNEVTDSADISNEERYSFPGAEVYEVDLTSSTEVPFKTVLLALSEALEPNREYRLKVADIKDCAGNSIDASAETVFALPEAPREQGLVINEVLFNPQTGGADFVELYNRTDAYFDLKDFALSNRGEDGELGTVYALAPQGYLVAPGEYVALTADKADIESRYEVRFPEKLLELSTLPSMPDSEGEVVLLASEDSIVLDELVYDADWHYTLLEDDDGYSLERIDPNAATLSQGNWHTASSTAGGATPTYINSQFRDAEVSENTIELSGESFSPDNDGFEDYVQINISSEAASQSVAIDVYNLSGQLVRNLVAHDLLGNKSVYQWNGFTDLQERAPIGVYIFLIEIVNLDSGTTERFKESVVLAGKI